MHLLSSFMPRVRLEVLIARVLSPVGIVLSGILLSLCVCVFGAWSLYEARQDAHVRAVQNARNVLLLVERDITRSIELYDLSLRAAVDGINDSTVMALPQALRDAVLFDRATAARNLDGILVLDEHGNVRIDTRKECPVGRNLSDREYFAAHRDQPGLGLYISKPYYSSCTSGRPVISLSRRISRPDGSFGGVVSGALAIDYFRELLEGLDVGNKGTAAVIETNGTLVARLPFDTKVIGRDLSQVDVFKNVMSATEGTFIGNASIDGTRKIYVFRRLNNLPIVVDVAPAEADVYAEWHDRRTYVASLIVVFSAVVVMSSLLLSRELTRRAEVESLLKRTARIDALTGLDNRGTFDHGIQREWRRAVRTASPLSLLFVDIDSFKELNDRYGHRVGDDVLKAVARSIGACVRRPADSVARYGGEEFVVTLPDTPAFAALTVAEIIRTSVSELVVRKDAVECSVTVSIGAATWAGQADLTADVLIELADKALYLAKTTGRNRVSQASWVDRTTDTEVQVGFE